MKKLFLFLILCYRLSAVDMSLTFTGDYYGSLADDTPLRFRLSALPELQGSFTDSLTWTIDLNLYYEIMGEETDPREFIHQAYIRMTWEKLDLFTGVRQIHLGKTDYYNPFNRVHNYTLKTTKPEDLMSDLSAEIQFYFNYDTYLSLVYVPFFKENNEKFYSGRTSHSLYLSFHTYTSWADLSLYYSRFTDHSPDYTYKDPGLNETYSSAQNAGFSVSSDLFGWAAALDTACFISGDLKGEYPGIKNSEFHNSFQLSKEFFYRLMVQGNLLWKYVFYQNNDFPSPWSQYDSFLNKSFGQEDSNSLMIRLSVKMNFFNERLEGKISGESRNMEEFYTGLIITGHLSDQWKLETGGDLYPSGITESQPNQFFFIITYTHIF